MTNRSAQNWFTFFIVRKYYKVIFQRTRKQNTEVATLITVVLIVGKPESNDANITQKSSNLFYGKHLTIFIIYFQICEYIISFCEAEHHMYKGSVKYW